MDEKTMPQFMFKSPRGTGYLFRRGVPADIREVIGKREFKVALGGDYRSACQRCRELAVETDEQIALARSPASTFDDTQRKVVSPPLAAASPSALTQIREVTSDLIAGLHAMVIEQVLNADKAMRYHTPVAVNPAEKLEEIHKLKSWAMMAKYGDETAVRGWSEMLVGTLKRNGYGLAPELASSLQERQLLIEYAAAYCDALDILEGEYSGKPSIARQAGTPIPQAGLVRSPTGQTMLLSAAVKEFLRTLAPNKRAMNEKHAFILPAFLEVIGDMPITELRQGHIKDFLRTVQKLPPRWSDLRRRKGQTIRELASAAWDETLSLNTYEGTYLASMRTFLEHAKRDWQDIGFPTTLSASVPYEGTRTESKGKQRALRLDEIRQIFFNETMQEIITDPAQAHKFWLLAIELYTGARVREICQLNPQQDWGRKDDIWWLRFTYGVGELPAPDVVKSVKTGKSRTIPMHTELVRLGLPEYLDRLKLNGARRLFPQWSSTRGNAGATPGKWVATYLRGIGIHGVMNEKGNAVRGSHAFRHTLLTYGRMSGVNLRCISGHADESDNPVADGYEDETLLLPLDVKADRLSKLDYGIELPIPVPVLIPATARQSRVSTSSPRVETRR